MARRMKNKLSALSIGSLVTTILAHIAVILFVVLARGYFNLELNIIICALIVIVCVLFIIDILLVYGINFKDIASRIVIIVLSVLMMVVGFGGSYYVSKVNKAVDNAIENTGTDQYETISGSFVYYSENGTVKYKDLDSLKSASNLKVGVVFDDGIGVATAAQKLMEDEGINATVTTYSSSEELLGNLIGNGTDDIDVAVFPSSYRQRWLADEEVDYAQYLDHVYDFHKFEDKVKTGENKNANKDLYTEPFNILLIGFAPEDEAMTVGLADSIIVATVNPQTFTVSLTSIARDTYTKLACAPNSERQKINAARAYSRQCLMDTVGELLDIDIDYYMEVNFLGVVEIVDALGGIVVNNPVEFVGQTASGIRGEFTVLVPAGENVPCDGEMALAFARERHAMPNGDFDRQKHQQEVIARIAEKLLGMNDVNKALKVMEAAGKNFTTNLSLNQLTGIFSYIINHKNTIGIPTFNMIEMQNMRVTGYDSWYYSYIMRLPQWIYRLYNGSIQECKDRINDVMNNYVLTDIKQPSYMSFLIEYPYERPQYYSEYFNEEQVHEKMPDCYPLFVGKDLATAMSLAQAVGITLNIKYIEPDSPDYKESLDGQIIDQYPRQGALVEEYPTGSITVMGNGDPNYVPEYTVENCNDEASCIAFAKSKGINYSVESKFDVNNEHKEGEITTSPKNGEKIKKDQTLIIYKWTKQIKVPAYAGKSISDYKAILDNFGLKYNLVETTTDVAENNGLVTNTNPAPDTVVSAGTVITVTYYKAKTPQVAVPDYNGMSLADYQNALSAAGLGYSTNSIGNDGGATAENNGKVASINVSVGTMVDKGSIITIYYYSYIEPTPTPNPEPNPEPSPEPPAE
ncbi:MAG: LCP family protein [Solobacterium sp.]|nr:LCP family protein [Solobacterium sp.]MDY5402599.1 LCP family protein [Erysipelotrichaceae bacterium]